ncbi:MAG TPA: hypothetical protein PKZ07_14470 [Sedimentisphaerales bacterium]|nr:hypothetical protein [Sedimentisphaerales bacterium]
MNTNVTEVVTADQIRYQGGLIFIYPAEAVPLRDAIWDCPGMAIAADLGAVVMLPSPEFERKLCREIGVDYGMIDRLRHGGDNAATALVDAVMNHFIAGGDYIMGMSKGRHEVEAVAVIRT